MKRAALSLCLMLFLCILAFSALTPDFSGTWIRDIAKSDAMATYVNGQVKPVSADLVVKHAGSNLQVETRWDYQAPTTKSYILDGNENQSTGYLGSAVTYRSSWDQDKLIIDEVVNANTPFGRAEVKTRYEWSLSEGGIPSQLHPRPTVRHVSRFTTDNTEPTGVLDGGTNLVDQRPRDERCPL